MMGIQKSPERLARHGMRRCGIVSLDYAVAHDPQHRETIRKLIDHQLGPDHPGYTVGELVNLRQYRRNRWVFSDRDLQSALELKELESGPGALAMKMIRKEME